jgi:hypothetical protein
MLRMDGDIGALLGRGADTSIGKILVKVGFWPSSFSRKPPA